MAHWLIGFHAIEEQLVSLGAQAAAGGTVLHVGSKPGPRTKKILELARSLGVSVQNSDEKILSQLCGNADHRGAVLVMLQDAVAVEPDFATVLAELSGRKSPAPLILALDSITDPHNLGAILRSADKFGVDLVLLPQRRSAQENETVRASSAGASAWVRTIVVSNLHRSLLACRDSGFWICGADMDGMAAPEFDAKQALVLVMGSEGKGIGRLLRECCDSIISIPCTGHVDSLNVSVAGGILLYEIRRQQGFIWT